MKKIPVRNEDYEWLTTFMKGHTLRGMPQAISHLIEINKAWTRGIAEVEMKIPKERILHLHVRKEYWYQVKNGEKNKEYRLIKPYWITRLKKSYNLIHYHLGYTKKVIVFRYVGYIKMVIKHKEFGDKPVNVFAIDLTKNRRDDGKETNLGDHTTI